MTTTNPKIILENVRNIRWGEVFAIVGIILSVGAWYLTRIDRQFDRIEITLERIERDNRDFHGRLAHIEGKLGGKDGR